MLIQFRCTDEYASDSLHVLYINIILYCVSSSPVIKDVRLQNICNNKTFSPGLERTISSEDELDESSVEEEIEEGKGKYT